MSKKPLKPPFYRLTAYCREHGQITVERKPNPKAGQQHPTGAGGTISPYPAGVVCTHCPWLCAVTSAELITDIEVKP